MAEGIASAFFDLAIRGQIYEKLIGRKSNMECYRGYEVPTGIREYAHLADMGCENCAFSNSGVDTGQLGCVRINCAGCICDRTHRDSLISFFKSEGLTPGEPADKLKKILKPGMLIRTTDGSCYLWVGGPSDEAYRVVLRNDTRRCDWVEIVDAVMHFTKFNSVDTVFASPLKHAPAVSRDCIVDLLKEGHPGRAEAIWKKPVPVKEMTVAEISKALGYEVKVVANEKADD